MSQNPEKGLNPSSLLRIFDRTVGVFVQIFDPRLLTLAIGVLMGYCALFTQRKFPGRWMLFILYGMLILAVVTLTARTPGLRGRIHWRRDMVTLWFLLCGMMLVSGFFNEDWLPEAVSLLVAYPMVFAVFSAREDHSTFQAIARGAVLGLTPFLVLSYLLKPVVFGYPGYYGLFYNANGLAMCSIALAVVSALLAQARFFEGKTKNALGYSLIFLLATVTIVLTWSRSAWVTFAGVVFVLLLAFGIYQAKHRDRVVVALCVMVILVGVPLGYFTYVKTQEMVALEYEHAKDTRQYYEFEVEDYNPANRHLKLDDFTSDRLLIWRTALQNLTWNGHDTSVIEEWAKIDGGDRRLNAHNSFVGFAYNHGWPAGILFLAYVGLSLYRALRYYRTHRSRDTLAITPLAITVCFIIESLFESVYAPFSIIGCLYLLVQGVLWRRDDPPQEGRPSP